MVPESWTESVYPTALVSIAGFCRIEIFIHHDGALGAPARLERTTCWFEERVPETGPNRLSLPTGYGLGTDEEPSGMSVSELDNNSVPQRPTGAKRRDCSTTGEIGVEWAHPCVGWCDDALPSTDSSS